LNNSRLRRRSVPRDKVLFVCSWFVVWMSLNAAFAIVTLRSVTSLSLLTYMLGQLLNLGISYGLIQGAFSLFSTPMWPPQDESGKSQPRVALLYMTCDDLEIRALSSLRRQRYPAYDLYVLDDSRKVSSRQASEQAAYEHAALFIHRDENSGFKAGSLNNWLRTGSSNYTYFVIADADSVLPEDFLDRMVRYAEHPDNKQIVVFQSKLAPWNVQDYLTTCETATLKIAHWKLDRLLNRYGYLVCWGHNALYRCEEIRKLGGFDERFSSEDLALAIDLPKHGYRASLVDVVSFERAPRTFDEYAQRSARWARQTLQLLLYKQKGVLPFLSRVHLFMDAFGFIMPVLFAIGAFLVTWSGTSSLRDFAAISGLAKLPHFPILAAMSSVYVFALFSDLPAVVFARGVSVRKYFVALWLRLIANLYSLAPITTSLVAALFSRRPRFQPTGSFQPTDSSGPRHLRRIVYLMAFVLSLGVGILRNPLILLFNWFWVLPLMTAPIVILWFTPHQIQPQEVGM